MTAENDWQAIAADQGRRLLRLQVAVHVLRAWGGAGSPQSAAVVNVLGGWIDAGMNGPVPWPDDAAFAHWAAQHGLFRMGGCIGHWGAARYVSDAVH